MAGMQRILRQAAIEKMASPEQLDMAMQVTPPVSWIAAVSLGVLVLAGALFSVVGRIAVRVGGPGLLLPGSGVRTVEAPADGRVRTLDVAEGQVVSRDQVVARLELGGSAAEIRAAGEAVRALEEQYRRQIAGSEGLKESLDAQAMSLRQRRRRVAGLVAENIRLPSELAKIDQEIAALEARTHQLDVEDAEIRGRLDEARRRLRQLEEEARRKTFVKSPYDGRVTAILKPVGQTIRAGERLINLEEPGAELLAYVFVPFAQGARVQQGMPVRISPSTVKVEEYGFILGTVEGRSPQPVTFEELRSLLQNDELARRYVKDNPYRVLARPEVDAACPGGLRWTSSCGPPEPIAANTPCTAQVIVGDKRPVEYLVLRLRQILGIGA